MYIWEYIMLELIKVMNSFYKAYETISYNCFL